MLFRARAAISVITIFLAVVFSSGCAPVGPNYQKPEIKTPDAWHKAISREMAKQSGAATADLYPRFAISGFFGLETGSFSEIGGGSSLAWGIKSPIKWNFFSGGRTRSNIALHKEIAQQDLFKYKDTVLKAMAEVKNAIVAHSEEKIRRDWLLEAVAATREAVDLVIVQYETGLTDFNNVLVTQKSLFEQQDKLVASQANVVLNLIRIYKALGGGWPIEEENNVSNTFLSQFNMIHSPKLPLYQ